MEFTYEEACEAALDSRELTDDELELVAGGAGAMYRRLVSGALAATLAFGAGARAPFVVHSRTYRPPLRSALFGDTTIAGGRDRN